MKMPSDSRLKVTTMKMWVRTQLWKHGTKKSTVMEQKERFKRRGRRMKRRETIEIRQ